MVLLYLAHNAPLQKNGLFAIQSTRTFSPERCTVLSTFKKLFSDCFINMLNSLHVYQASRISSKKNITCKDPEEHSL